MLRETSKSPLRLVLVLNRGNLPCRLVENLAEAGIRFQLVAGIKDVEFNDPTISCILFPIRELPSVVVHQTVRRFACRYPLVLVDDAANLHSIFEAGRVGAHELLVWPRDKEELSAKIRRAREAFVEDSTSILTERAAINLVKRLTVREKQIVRGVIEGKVNKQMAADFQISQKTVEYHRSRAMKKLRVASVAELVRLVLEAEKSN